MTPADGLASVPGSDESSLEDLPAYCANPLCRKEFRRKVGPGRRQEYCTELCRRTAEREYRRTLQRLAHLENQVEQHRNLAAAFGRGVSGEVDGENHLTPEDRRAAEDAVVRVGGMLTFLQGSDDPLAIELRALHAAVQPIISR